MTTPTLAEAYPPVRRGTLVVWGLLAAHPYGGMVWQVLHHLVGLRRLGFDVWYVEDSLNPFRRPSDWCPTEDPAETLGFVAGWMERIGFSDRWIVRVPGPDRPCRGAGDDADLDELYRRADAVLNLCGGHRLRDEHAAIERLVLLQTDPVAQQIAIARGDRGVIDELDHYDDLFTYGENIGSPGCGVPVERYRWIPTRPPVVLEWWNGAGPPADDAPLTTIGNWRNEGADVVWRGETYRWRKDLEFRKVADLPERSPLPLELALVGIPHAEAEEMRRRGWTVTSGMDLADPWRYRAYIRASRGELTVAKDQNVRLRSGWFSDRSACYLAAGRPVVTQDTGFGDSLPTGEGLLAFRTADEAAEAIRAVAGDGERHARAAAGIAREHFAAERVLGEVARRLDLA